MAKTTDGRVHVTVVDGTTRVPQLAADGSLNVVLADGTYFGIYHPCGALQVTRVSGTSYAGFHAMDGSINVIESSSPACGALRVNVVSGSLDPFSPLALSPSLWLDPSDLSTMFQDTAGTTPVTADGQSVARINDKSGNGLHFLQSTASQRPLYKTNGTLHWLLFDGVDDILEGNSTTALNFGVNNLAFVVAFQQDPNGGNYKAAFAKTDNATGSNYRAFLDGGYSLRILNGTDADQSSNSFTVATQGSDWVAVWGRDATDDRYELNATSVTRPRSIVGTGSSTFAPKLFGDGSATYAMGGRCYGALAMASYPDSTNMASLKTWLGAKAGLTL